MASAGAARGGEPGGLRAQFAPGTAPQQHQHQHHEQHHHHEQPYDSGTLGGLGSVSSSTDGTSFGVTSNFSSTWDEGSSSMMHVQDLHPSQPQQAPLQQPPPHPQQHPSQRQQRAQVPVAQGQQHVQQQQQQHQQQQQQQPHPGQQQQQPPPPPPLQERQLQQLQQQQSQQEHDEAPPARLIRAHTSRPAVSRSLLQHTAKAFGVRLRGDVETNEISTAKYTLLTFLPVNLFEQFLRVANLYFLLMAILQLIPGLSPTSWFTTVAPLVFVLAVNAIKEGYDDVHRHRNDNQINNRHVLRLCKEAGEEELFWKDVVAGDLIKVRAGEEVPADLLLLSSPDPENLCYVETANLDGETNLKIKYCWSRFVQRTKVAEFQDFADKWVVGCEAPNPRLYVFDGFVETTDGGRSVKMPVDINNLLLRGCVLRTTEWVIGVAINVGQDSKIVRNMTKAPRKVTQLEQAMNRLVLVQFTILLAFSATLAGLDQWWTRTHSDTSYWYLQSLNVYPDLAPGGAGWVIAFLRFIILLSNMIPISLYVSLEVVKVFQCALLLNRDRQMYHRDTDTPFVCRTTTLNEELGQVQYVLSDKTGTLTQNVMGFVWASVAGKLYGKEAGEEHRPPGVPAGTPHSIALDPVMQKAAGLGGPDAAGKAAVPAVHDFLLNLAVCNTVVPSRRDDGSLQYQASSPDEEALVEGAAYLGYRLVGRTTEQVVVEVHGASHTYDILATLEFNSDRKRMSIIVRSPQDTLLLMCKGADSIILKRLAEGEAGRATVSEHLDEMARGGYRTLLISQREVSREEFKEWEAAYATAQVAMVAREERMAAEQDRIERGLRLVGATAVEDKLQDGVPECLEALARAGIKVWVLTGDKVETAISIAHSCCLFTDDMGIVEVRETHFQDAKDVPAQQQLLAAKLAEVRAENARRLTPPGHTNVGIVIEGGALNVALAPQLQDGLMALCRECKAVVCCRVSPMQKAQITTMVKRKAGAITLGIGDGANDVGMIRAAHIGVGISGREGRAAVLASDFSFAQFRYLARLLLVHGRWSYLRNEEVVLYSFYKNWAYVLVYVYLQFLAGFSAVPIFTTMMISTFNMIFTACPIVAYAVLEQDLHIRTVLDNPQTYSTTRTATRAGFFWKFIRYVFVIGTWHSLPCFFVPWYTLVTPHPAGLHEDLAGAGTAVFIALVFAVTLKLFLRTHCWSWVTHLVYWLSLGLLFPFVWVISVLWGSTDISGVSDMSGVGVSLFTSAVFWLGALLLAPAIALLPDIAVLLFRRYLRPSVETLLQEQEVLAVLETAARQKRDSKVSHMSVHHNLQIIRQPQHAGDGGGGGADGKPLPRNSRASQSPRATKQASGQQQQGQGQGVELGGGVAGSSPGRSSTSPRQTQQQQQHRRHGPSVGNSQGVQTQQLPVVVN